MTLATFVPSRPGVFADTEQTARGFISTLRGKLADRRLHRRTVAELRALSMRQREDLGFAGHDMAQIARQAMRRN